MLANADNVDDVYVQEVLPGKMKYNLESIRKFSFWGEIRTMVRTVTAVMEKEERQGVSSDRKRTGSQKM